LRLPERATGLVAQPVAVPASLDATSQPWPPISRPARPGRALFSNDLRSLLAGRSLWTMVVLLSLLIGASFIQAVNLFAQASRSALQFPERARGMAPLDGLVVPTLGALYLKPSQSSGALRPFW
jgi:hypothetical protein